MKVTNLVQQPRGWTRFHLSVGGFVVKNCRWHGPTGRSQDAARDRRKERHPFAPIAPDNKSKNRNESTPRVFKNRSAVSGPDKGSDRDITAVL